MLRNSIINIFKQVAILVLTKLHDPDHKNLTLNDVKKQGYSVLQY